MATVSDDTVFRDRRNAYAAILLATGQFDVFRSGWRTVLFTPGTGKVLSSANAWRMGNYSLYVDTDKIVYQRINYITSKVELPLHDPVDVLLAIQSALVLKEL